MGQGGGTVASRTAGLVADNVESFGMVLANGTFAVASANGTSLHIYRSGIDTDIDSASASAPPPAPHRRLQQHGGTDLWWAVRGGGGGAWGVLVNVTFRTTPQPEHVVAVSCQLPLTAPGVQSYFDLLQAVPDGWGFSGITFIWPLAIAPTYIVTGVQCNAMHRMCFLVDGSPLTTKPNTTRGLMAACIPILFYF